MATRQKELTPDPATTKVATAPTTPQNSPNHPPDSLAPRTNEATALAAPRQKWGAMTRVGSHGVEFDSMADMWDFAVAGFRSGMVAESLKNEAACFIAIQAGLEVGLSIMTALQNVCVIKGKPSFYGPILVGLCRTKPDWVEAAYTQTVTGEGGDRHATVTMQRVGGQPHQFTYSMKDAEQANLLGKDNWKNYPDDMLVNRARGRGLKALFSHHLYGISIADEMEDVAYTEASRTRIGPAPGVVDAVGDLAESLGVKPEPVKPLETAPVADQTWAGWFRKTIAEATAPVDLDGLGAHIMQSHDKGQLSAAEANAVTQELEAALERLAKR